MVFKDHITMRFYNVKERLSSIKKILKKTKQSIECS